MTVMVGGKKKETKMKTLNFKWTALALAAATTVGAGSHAMAAGNTGSTYMEVIKSAPCPLGMTLSTTSFGTPRCIGEAIRINSDQASSAKSPWTAGGVAYQGLSSARTDPNAISFGGGSVGIAPAHGYTGAQTSAQDYNLPTQGISNDVIQSSQGFIASIGPIDPNEQRAFVQWQMTQTHLFGYGKTIGDDYLATGKDPYNSSNMAMAQEQITRYNNMQAQASQMGMIGAAVKPWSAEGQAIQADTNARVAANNAATAAYCAANGCAFSFGSGSGPVAAPAPVPSQASVNAQIQSDLASLPKGDQGALNQWLAAAPGKYTPQQLSSASGYNEADIISAITAAKTAATAPAPATISAPVAVAAPAPVGSFCSPWGTTVTWDSTGAQSDTGGGC